MLGQPQNAFTAPHDTTRPEAHGTEGSIVVRDATIQDTEITVELFAADGRASVDSLHVAMAAHRSSIEGRTIDPAQIH